MLKLEVGWLSFEFNFKFFDGLLKCSYPLVPETAHQKLLASASNLAQNYDPLITMAKYAGSGDSGVQHKL